MTQFLDLPTDILLLIAELAQKDHPCTWRNLKQTCHSLVPIGNHCMPYGSFIIDHSDILGVKGKLLENWMVYAHDRKSDKRQDIKYIPVHRIRQFWAIPGLSSQLYTAIVDKITCWPAVEKLKLSSLTKCYDVPSVVFPALKELDIYVYPVDLILPTTLHTLRIHMHISKTRKNSIDNLWPQLHHLRLTTLAFIIIADDILCMEAFLYRYRSHILQHVTEIQLVLHFQCHFYLPHARRMRDYLHNLRESTILQKVRFECVDSLYEEEEASTSKNIPVFLPRTSIEDQLQFYWQASSSQYSDYHPDPSLFSFRTSLTKLRGPYTMNPHFLRNIICQGDLPQLRTLNLDFIQHWVFHDPTMHIIMENVSTMTQLESLKITGIPQFLDELKAWPCFLKLRKLRIENDTNADLVQIDWFQKMPNLTSLTYNVSYPYRISWHLKSCPNLRKLDITSIVLPTDIPAQLEELCWTNEWDSFEFPMDWVQIIDILRTHPNLRILKLRFPHFLDDSFIAALQGFLPQLISLHLLHFQIYGYQKDSALSLFPYCLPESISYEPQSGNLFNRYGYSYKFHFTVSPICQ